MKNNDWTMIIFVAVMAAVVAFVLTNSIMGDSGRKPTESVKVTVQFSDKVDQLSGAVFYVGNGDNESAINPAVTVTTGNGKEDTIIGTVVQCSDLVNEWESLASSLNNQLDLLLDDPESVSESEQSSLDDSFQSLENKVYNVDCSGVVSDEQRNAVLKRIAEIQDKNALLEKKYQ